MRGSIRASALTGAAVAGAPMRPELVVRSARSGIGAGADGRRLDADRLARLALRRSADKAPRSNRAGRGRQRQPCKRRTTKARSGQGSVGQSRSGRTDIAGDCTGTLPRPRAGCAAATACGGTQSSSRISSRCRRRWKSGQRQASVVALRSVSKGHRAPIQSRSRREIHSLSRWEVRRHRIRHRCFG